LRRADRVAPSPDNRRIRSAPALTDRPIGTLKSHTLAKGLNLEPL
jgi:hypothetical protein